MMVDRTFCYFLKSTHFLIVKKDCLYYVNCGDMVSLGYVMEVMNGGHFFSLDYIYSLTCDN